MSPALPRLPFLALACTAWLSGSCISPKSGTDVRQTVRGSFVGGAVSAQTPDGGITLTGQLSFSTGQLSFSTTRPQVP